MSSSRSSTSSEEDAPIPPIEPKILADLLQSSCSEKVLLIDARCFAEYNTSHIRESVNLPTSCLMKRRLAADKITVPDLLHLQPGFIEKIEQIVVLDADSQSFDDVDQNSFLHLTVQKLSKLPCPNSRRISFLRGGHKAFQTSFPCLCAQQGDKVLLPVLSQPNMPSLDCGPTKIFSHMYLGSEKDALSLDVLKSKGISYVLNVSQSCAKAEFIKDSHFMRIPVNDTYSDKLICHFLKAFQFLEKVKSSNGCALVHCMAGVSRSPAVAIAYVMSHSKLPYDQAYRYVKEKRPCISPNFNFLGQLLEFDKRMREKSCISDSAVKHQLSPSPSCSSLQACSKRQRLHAIRISAKNTLGLNLAVASGGPAGGFDNVREDISPSAGIRRLTLGAE